MVDNTPPLLSRAQRRSRRRRTVRLASASTPRRCPGRQRRAALPARADDRHETRVTFAEIKRAKDYSSDSSASEKETEGHSEGRIYRAPKGSSRPTSTTRASHVSFGDPSMKNRNNDDGARARPWRDTTARRRRTRARRATGRVACGARATRGRAAAAREKGLRVRLHQRRGGGDVRTADDARASQVRPRAPAAPRRRTGATSFERRCSFGGANSKMRILAQRLVALAAASRRGARPCPAPKSTASTSGRSRRRLGDARRRVGPLLGEAGGGTSRCTPTSPPLT